MIKLFKNEELASLGWKIIHQVHDEIILEGPEETVERASLLVKENMENPFSFSLRIKMEADVKICNNWSEGK